MYRMLLCSVYYVTHPGLIKTHLLTMCLTGWDAKTQHGVLRRDFQPKQIGTENQDIHQRYHTNRLWTPHYWRIHAHAALKSELFTAVS